MDNRAELAGPQDVYLFSLVEETYKQSLSPQASSESHPSGELGENKSH